MTIKVTNSIINAIKNARYFSIIVDSTPDISHTDQLSYVIGYIQNDSSLVERFTCFLPNVGQSQQLEETVMSVINVNAIEIKNCRGQSHDNVLHDYKQA